MADALIALIETMDQCWIERRFDDLRGFMAPDIIISVPGADPVVGIDAVIDTYRDFMSRCRLIHFAPSGHVATVRGHAAIVEYGWEMIWQEGSEEISAAGREIVGLEQSDGAWTIFWRTQLPA